MGKWRVLVPMLLLVTGLKVWAQQVRPVTFNLELAVQELLAQPDNANLNYEEVYENLLQFYQQPLHLNLITREELESLFILSPAQVSSFLEYRQQNGPLLNIYELQAIPGLDLATIHKLLPFVSVPEGNFITQLKPLWLRLQQEQNQYVIVRYDRSLHRKKGFTVPDTSSAGRLSSRYQGSPDKFLIRYRNSHARDFSVGFTAEKDAGEQFVWDSRTHRYGLDFYSAHLQLYNKGNFKTIALGDYQLQFGQGLLLGAGFFAGKGAETITTLRRSSLGIRPYTSVLEAAFLRGAAFTYAWRRHWELTTFYSRKRLDGNVAFSTDSLAAEEAAFAAIQATGLHRTPAEIAGKHQLGEQIYGGNITYRAAGQPFTIGITAVNTLYSAARRPAPRAYNQFEFTGRRNANLGLHYTYNWQNFNFFGETARSANGGWGMVNGMLASLSNQVEASLLYRNYSRHFHSFYGTAFGENNRNSNERGWYFGLKIRPATLWELTAYYDVFTFPWLKYRVDAPSHGKESLIRLQYHPIKKVLLYGQFRVESKGRNEPVVAQHMDVVSQATRRSYLLYLDYSPLAVVNLRSRIQWSTFQQTGPPTKGYLMAQDVTVELQRWQLSTRYSIFDTDNYDNRQYTTERDVLYAFSVPALNGTGSHFYLLLQFKATRSLDFWLKYSATIYRHQTTIGSGLEEINGNRKDDIRVQVRYGFH